MSDAPHVPVLLDEVVDALQPAPGKTVVDGTFGAGGYSRAFLDAGASVIAFDRDPSAAPVRRGPARRPLPPGRAPLLRAGRRGRARAPSTAWRSTSASPPCSSTRPSAASPSCATGRWTCAWRADGPTAADLVNERRAGRAGPHPLRLRRGARRAAASPRAIARRRAEQPFTRTLELAEFIEKALGGRRGAKVHPATRSFQALRIAVNEELVRAGGRPRRRRARAEGRRAALRRHVPFAGRQNREDLPRRCGPGGRRRDRATRRRCEAGAAPSFELLFNGARGAVGGGAGGQPPGPLGETEGGGAHRRARSGGRRHEPGSTAGSAASGWSTCRAAALLAVLILGVYLAKTIAGRERAEIAARRAPDRRREGAHPPAAGRGQPPGAAGPHRAPVGDLPRPGAGADQARGRARRAGRARPQAAGPPAKPVEVTPDPIAARRAEPAAPPGRADPAVSRAMSLGAADLRRLAALALARRAGLAPGARLRARPRLGPGRGRHPHPHLRRAGAVRDRLRGRWRSGATRAALFSDAGKGDGYAPPIGAARADLVDRNGQMLAADLLHYGLYIDPREIWDTAETRRALAADLPDLTPRAAGEGAARRPPHLRDRRPDAGGPRQDPRPGPARRQLRAGAEAGLSAGLHRRPPDRLRRHRRRGPGRRRSRASTTTSATPRPATATVPLSIDLRVQAALEDELYKAAAQFQPKGAVGVVINVHTGEILGLASYPDLRSRTSRARPASTRA